VLEAKIAPLESHLWRLFAELMDTDCLNSTNLEQFLPMKNKVQIKMVLGDKPALSINESLKEAFADL
jgi:hypothetical protein